MNEERFTKQCNLLFQACNVAHGMYYLNRANLALSAEPKYESFDEFCSGFIDVYTGAALHDFPYDYSYDYDMTLRLRRGNKLYTISAADVYEPDDGNYQDRFHVRKFVNGGPFLTFAAPFYDREELINYLQSELSK